MSIVSWLRVDWLLDTVDVTLDWHVLIVAITLTRAITVIGILGIKINALLLCISYVATWLLVYQINFLALVSCLVLRWIGVSLNRRRLIERGIVWDFRLLKTRAWVHVLVLKASLRILTSLDMITNLLWGNVLSYIWDWMRWVILDATDVLVWMFTLWTIAFGDDTWVYDRLLRLWRDWGSINSININCLLDLLIEYNHFTVTNLFLSLRWQVWRQHLLLDRASWLPFTWNFLVAQPRVALPDIRLKLFKLCSRL